MSINYRLSHEPSARDKFYTNVAPIITGLGASVAIVGALFKILHLPGAAPMLVVGLGAEAILFGLFAFAPAPTEPDWTLIHPQLAGDSDPHAAHGEGDKATPGNLTKKLDVMLDQAGLNQDSITKFATGLNSLSTTVSQMNDLSSAATASNEYATNVKAASASITEMNKSYSKTVEAMSSMANATVDAKEYHTQVQSITKNLGALNAVYEMELQDANNHLKSMNKFYGNLSSAMESMVDASKDANQFKNEMARLTANLTTLNNVYGNMLSAMKG